jgi:tetratricopeptide (TPR) repeat protein
MLVELGKTKEQQDDFDGALALFAAGRSDELSACLCSLLVRMGRLQEASSLDVLGPRSRAEMGRLASVGFGDSMVVSSSSALASGRVMAALGSDMFKREILLKAVDVLVKAHEISSLGRMGLLEMNAALSNAFFKRALMNTAEDVESGIVKERIEDVVSFIHTRDRLDWRVLFNLARIASSQEERIQWIQLAAASCEASQTWKVWLDASSLFERGSALTRHFLALAEAVSSEKGRASVLLTAAASEDDLDLAERILRKAVSESPSSWKSRADLSLLLAKTGRAEEAVQLVKDALSDFPQIGRLWALFARLSNDEVSVFL